MIITEAFVALGGNIGDTPLILHEALKRIADLPSSSGLRISRFYVTSPVSDIPQNDYVNAVCCFKTGLSARELLLALQKIERDLGKTPKNKNAPRIIDLDILFFGQEIHDEIDLAVPHPRWQERLFVLTPLSDLVQEIVVPQIVGEKRSSVRLKLHSLLKNFNNIHNETVSLFHEQLAV